VCCMLLIDLLQSASVLFCKPVYVALPFFCHTLQQSDLFDINPIYLSSCFPLCLVVLSPWYYALCGCIPAATACQTQLGVSSGVLLQSLNVALLAPLHSVVLDKVSVRADRVVDQTDV